MNVSFRGFDQADLLSKVKEASWDDEIWYWKEIKWKSLEFLSEIRFKITGFLSIVSIV